LSRLAEENKDSMIVCCLFFILICGLSSCVFWNVVGFKNYIVVDYTTTIFRDLERQKTYSDYPRIAKKIFWWATRLPSPLAGFWAFLGLFGKISGAFFGLKNFNPKYGLPIFLRTGKWLR
jgi:hypothetical protein